MARSVRKMSPAERLEFWKTANVVMEIPVYRDGKLIAVDKICDNCVVKTPEERQAIQDRCNEIFTQSLARRRAEAEKKAQCNELQKEECKFGVSEKANQNFI